MNCYENLDKVKQCWSALFTSSWLAPVAINRRQDAMLAALRIIS